MKIDKVSPWLAHCEVSIPKLSLIAQTLTHRENADNDDNKDGSTEPPYSAMPGRKMCVFSRLEKIPKIEGRQRNDTIAKRLRRRNARVQSQNNATYGTHGPWGNGIRDDLIIEIGGEGGKVPKSERHVPAGRT